METFDLTPDPKILIALTRTPLKPMDALCELIDNAIDSFQTAILQGQSIETPIVIIDIPMPSEINNGAGKLVVRDNGGGLSIDMAEKALRAGFSGNNPYDSLGLFGMGFNISTGKLGGKTRFLTTRTVDDKALVAEIDLEAMAETKSYTIPIKREEKDINYKHGTIVEVSGWWPQGNPNENFMRTLANYSKPTIRRELGRRYASILKNRGVRLILNGEPCEPFEHCVWGDHRFVERQGHGIIPAVIRFDEVVGSQKRCGLCTALVPPDQNQCPACGSSNLRTIQERIRGWLGIQRYDDQTEFGIDLIRNGRAIRIGEKNAFFEYTDEFNRTIKDYPIDSPYGRIVGEVNLDHVPVDFLKQDFQRTSPEWQRAITFLRGESSLQPTQPGAATNNSPIFKLYQGFRRVRNYGKRDMYMGYWDNDSDNSKRISRDIEKEYLQKFSERLPGYYDDAEWWKLVETADEKPIDDLVICPECNSENLKGHDTCAVCGHVLIGKKCINNECEQLIPQSSLSCPICGVSQIPTILEPWTCKICGTKNSADNEICKDCGATRGALNPISQEFLCESSNKSDELSIDGCSIPLADLTYSQPFNVNTYITNGSIASYQNQHQRIPLISFKGENFDIFIDVTHPLFRTYGIQPEQIIASEIAVYIYDLNRRLSGQQYQGYHTLTYIQWAIVQKYWGEKLEDSPNKVKEDVKQFFAQLREFLSHEMATYANDIYNSLSEQQIEYLILNLLKNGYDLSKLNEIKQSGSYLNYVDDETLIEIFKRNPDLFFDGKYWNDPYSTLTDLPNTVIIQAQQLVKDTVLNCLEDIARFDKYSNPEITITKRARESLQILLQKAA